MYAVALSADGRHALSGGGDRTVIWWDLMKGQAVHILKEHIDWVHAVALVGRRPAAPCLVAVMTALG